MTKHKMLRHDFYFKSLLSSLFPDFIQLFFPSMFSYLDVSSLSSMDKELLSDFNLQQTNAVDLVMKAKYKNQDSFFLIHVEVQSHPQVDFPQHFFEYFILLYAKYRLPIYPIVSSLSTNLSRLSLLAMSFVSRMSAS